MSKNCRFSYENCNDSKRSTVPFSGNKQIKINSLGKYGKFEGTTIICFLSKKDREKYKKVHDFIKESKVIQKYYSPLPVDSYHMTILNIFTRKYTKDYGQRLEKLKKMIGGINGILNQVQLCPRTAKTELYTRGTMGVRCELNNVVNEHFIQPMRSGMAANIGVKYDQNFQFHMTLGYRYKNVIIEDKPAFLDEVTALNKLVNSIGNVTFEKTQLCYFEDMTSFIPM